MFALIGRRVGGTDAAFNRAAKLRKRLAASVLATAFLAVAVLLFPHQAAAVASPSRAPSPNDFCSIEEFARDPLGCVQRLGQVVDQELHCLHPPSPAAPDSGLAGWFASRPSASARSGVTGLYMNFGYAGYFYTTYNQCFAFDSKFENTIANAEFMLATAVVGAANALRERAWDAGSLFDWADPLVSKATRALYEEVFTVFGVITLIVVGLYLLWRSRQAEMSAAVTTTGWALLVMVVVTALAAWPETSAKVADQALVTSLQTIHDAVGPPKKDIPPAQCQAPDPAACRDNRPPALRASDTAVETILYRNWLRGFLGSADSETARKYGRIMYEAQSLSWDEQQAIADDPARREALLRQKADVWRNFAGRIKAEDPAAYEYLTGERGIERIGAGFIALLSAIMFALFDVTASILVLLGFLIFRWAVIAAPLIGTIGLLRPASAGFRRLVNAVVAALFNIVIFGTGSAIYLFAFDLIMSTPALPGWLQVVLVWLCGVVGWLLLRPYRRITQLGGGDSTAVIASAGRWHRRFFRDVRETAPVAVAAPAGGSEPVVVDRPPQRIEVRADPALQVDVSSSSTDIALSPPRQRMPAPSGEGWVEPTPEPVPSYAIYRPSRSPVTANADTGHGGSPVRAEARRDE